MAAGLGRNSAHGEAGGDPASRGGHGRRSGRREVSLGGDRQGDDEKKRRVNIAKEAGGCLAGRVALVFSHRRVGPSRVGGCIVLLHGMVGV
jgi:hypothetical protein